eukprot:CAMPEP_0195511962 /NCGR_PEP_ID=MMETSP0794_2-20130614/4102_1 /TAXON_ID=515487 /ORGANISM="Stephanopyxis turris, Strain CCMP 815" /LENGTH=281 /DNA_ID=CAMNT_0040639663 /DNA_START=55 /DNA_END=900 /DNA_ORIENTATION=+
MTMKALITGLISCSIHLTTGFAVSTGRFSTRPTTELRGGYDATIGADPSTPIQFFTLPGNTCPYAQRTHIALGELGLPFDITEVSGMPKPDWYLKINPRGKVPALRIPTADNAVIYESAICNEFLCDHATAQSLMPADPFIRAKIRLLNDHCDNVFAKTQFTYLMNKDDAKDVELCKEMENALVAYEDALKESKGPYLLGEDFTLADVHAFPFLQRLVITLKHWKDYELPNDKFPNILTWIDSCAGRESVKESSMSQEKTIELYERFVGADYKFGGLNKNK